jgi:cell wall-associated NlpC family hydrolase
LTFPCRIHLLVLVLAFALTSVSLSPAGALAATRPTIPSLPNPARLPASVPLQPVARKIVRTPTLGERAVQIAAQELGVPYRYGGSSPSGFDCSGLTSWVYGRLGIELPHNAAAQYGYGTPVDLEHLEPGDLVFFHGLGHVGLYIGNGRIIHAPQTGRNVEIQALDARSGDVEGARRIRAT